MTTIKPASKHTEGELWLILRQEEQKLTMERMKLTSEISQMQRRIDEIDQRQAEIKKAEDILSGGL